MKKCGIEDLEKVLSDASGQVIDVREPAEYEAERIEGITLLPFSRLSEGAAAGLKKDKPLYLLCRTGNRASAAAARLQGFGFQDLTVVEGGLQAWVEAGKTLRRGASGVWSLERQVRFAAGALVLAGISLAVLLHPIWSLLSVFVACGLIFSAITDTCGMAMLLAKMPWNQKK